MSSLERLETDDDESYQRRRDIHRANFLMCERRPEEDDRSFRSRLDDMTEAFRSKRTAWSDSARRSSSAASERARHAVTQASTGAQDMYSSNPLVGGILAAAVGAAFGSALPVTRQEKEKLGSVGLKAREMASEQKDQLTSKAVEKKDELLDEVDQKLQREGSQSQSQAQQQQPKLENSGALGGNR